MVPDNKFNCILCYRFSTNLVIEGASCGVAVSRWALVNSLKFTSGWLLLPLVAGLVRDNNCTPNIILQK